MSVVVALRDGDRVLVGCDSQISAGYTKALLTSQRKIWKPSGDADVVMGVVGSWRDANILQTVDGSWVDELTRLKNAVDFKYAVRQITPKIFRELGTYGRMNRLNGMDSIESHITFAYKDRAYVVEADGAVIELEDILISGSGTRLGLGAWNSVKDLEGTAEEKLLHVIKSACESDLYVNYPIIIMNTKDDKVEVITTRKGE